MPDLVLIPLSGIGTLSLTRDQYEAALIPIKEPSPPEAPATRPTLEQTSFGAMVPSAATDPSPTDVSGPCHLRYQRLPEVCHRVGLRKTTIYFLV
jgi:hypothetical protein